MKKFYLLLFVLLALPVLAQNSAESWVYPVGTTTADCAKSLAPSVLLFGECRLVDGIYLTNDGGLTWNKFQGTPGTNGTNGVDGKSATIAINSVVTVPPGTPAFVNNIGNSLNALLDIGLPQGPKGDKGDTGPQGAPGVNWTTCDVTITNFKIMNTTTRTGTLSVTNCH